ncbi:hypothetical protein DVH24_028202 [Malus domestica]|uniref:Uncharacterized protein n=1 Tax=Malus domestica TaxID=3750 RepID=A0A498HF21_MALDO|nr:hypothetical protein DVH24_028202 [Malus domestica]
MQRLKEELSITLRAEVAESFSSLSLQALSLPIVIVFSNSKNLVKILPPSSSQLNEAKVLRTTRRVTIDELAFLDPDLHKMIHFCAKLLLNVLIHVTIGGCFINDNKG